jgi:ABC-2 type transport system permease protein
MSVTYSSANHASANHGAARRPVADVLADTGVMVARSLRRSVRDPEAFITALALPVMLMLLFVYVFGGAFDAGVHTAAAGTRAGYANYVVPGLIVLCAAYGAGTTAVAVATDMSTGIVDRFRSMPIAAGTVLAGQIAASLARNLLATALVIGAGLAVGWRPTGGPLDWIAAAGLIVLFIAALSWLAACFGLVAGSPEAATGATFALMFIPYLSSAFVPAETMTRVLRPVAANQPFTPLVEAMRGLWMGHTSTGAAVGHEVLLAVAYFGAILILAASLASWLFRHRTASR